MNTQSQDRATKTHNLIFFLQKLLSNSYYDMDKQEIQLLIPNILKKQISILKDQICQQDIQKIYADIQSQPSFKGFFDYVEESKKQSIQQIAQRIIDELKVKDRYKLQLLQIIVSKDYSTVDRILSGNQKIKLNQLLSQYYLIQDKDEKQEHKPQSENKQLIVQQQMKISKEINKPNLDSMNDEKQQNGVFLLSHFLKGEGLLEVKSMLLLKYFVQLFTSVEPNLNNISTNWENLTLQQKIIQFGKLEYLQIKNISNFLLTQIRDTIKLCRLCLLCTLEIRMKKQSSNNQISQKIQSEINRLINNAFQSEQFQLKVTNGASRKSVSSLDTLFRDQKDIENQLLILKQYISQKQIELYYKLKLKLFTCKFNHQQFKFQSTDQDLYKNIEEITKTKIQNLLFFCQIEDSLQYQPTDISDLPKFSQFKIFGKQAILINYKEQRTRIDISKDLNLNQLKKLIMFNINKKQPHKLTKEFVRLNLVFQKKMDKIIREDEPIHLIESQYGNITIIQVEIKSSITLYYRGEEYKFRQWQNQPILILKQQIKQKLEIPVQSQILQYESDKLIIEMESKQSLSKMKLFESQIDVSLLVKANLEFYGFHNNIPLIYQRFKQFFIENPENRNDYFSICKLKEHQENLFFNKTIPYIFSSIKKRLDLESVIRVFRQEVSQHTKQQIWTSSKETNTFNPTFLIYYILYNSESKLRVEIMNLIKHYYPLPIFFKQFLSITDIQSNWLLNKQLVWILKEEPNIVSIGLHNQDSSRIQLGKSDLLNKIFYTNFVPRFSKHNIALGCPEISLQIYGSTYPANLIDISSKTPQNISDEILKKANFVILHSWKNQWETNEEIKRIKALNQKGGVYIITIMRDVPMESKDNWLIRAKQLFNNTIQLYDLSAKVDPITIEIMIKQIKKIIHHKIKQVLFTNQELTVKGEIINFSNNQALKFQNLLKQLQGILTGFRPVTHRYKLIQSQNSSVELLETKLKQNIQQFKLHPLLQQILLFIFKNSSESDLLMERFRQRIKSFRQSFQQKYKILVYAKKDIDRLVNEKSYQYQQKLGYYINVIKNLPGIKPLMTNTRISVLSGLSEAISEYQDNIKPQLISIESIWRELYQLVAINPHYQLGDQLLIDFIVDIQKKQIFNSQPFELLDGDSLRMPKKIIKKLFSSVKGTAATVIILGPQSSGKSTLLNYLFGCDFKTSQGRCTRGVYGTYYNISNSSMFSCESIFLIDTEGLLSITNKKDQKIRSDFDSKLILFCLAVSDFVIVNTKSDLDSETIAKLKVCKQRLPTLSQNANPQFWLVMNQSQTSDLSNKAQDVNRLQDLFDLGNSRCLSQAFDTKVIGSQQICILGFDIMTKKKSRNDFQKMTLKLQNQLMQRISTKSYRPIPEIIDKMEVIWSTIQRYPDLGRNLNNQIKQIDLQINRWKQQHSQELNLIKDKLLNDLEAKTKSAQQILSEFVDFRRKFEQQFQRSFTNKQNSQSIIERIIMKRKVITQQFEYIFKRLKNMIQDYEIKSKIKIQQQQGNIDIKTEIKRIKQEQIEKSITLTQQQKIERFQKIFNKTIQKLQKSVNEEEQAKNQFQRVKQYYQSRIKQHSISSTIGFEKILLPKFNLPPLTNLSYSEYRNQVLKQFSDESNMNMIIQNSKAPHTNVLAGGKTDASLKYFNMNDYFEKKQTIFFLVIRKGELFPAFKAQNFQNELLRQFNKLKQNEQYDIIKKIVRQINTYLRYHDLKFQDQNTVTSFILNMMSQIKLKTKTQEGFINNIYNYFCPKNEKQQFPRLNIVNTAMEQQVDLFIQSKFLKYNILEQAMLQSEKKQKCSYLNHLSQKILRQVLDYELIFKKIQSNKNIKQKKIMCVQKFSKELDDEFAVFGLTCNTKQYVWKLINNENNTEKKIKFTQIQKLKKTQIKSIQKFQASITQLKWFTCIDIKRGIKQKQQVQDSQFCLAKLTKSQLKAKQEKSHYEIKKYLDQQSRQVMDYLKNMHTLKFLWDQLHSKQAFENLFQQFDKIIQDCISKNTSLTKTIQQIFSSVTKQIRKFDDDISQLSKKLTFNFQGICHMFVIYMTWKTISIKQQGILQKPVQEWKQQKEKQFQYFMNMTSNLTEKICEGEVEQFVKKIMEIYTHRVEKIKQKIIKKEIYHFQHNNTREEIQNQIDHETFQTGADQQKMIEYIEEPQQILRGKINEAIERSVDNLHREIKNEMYHINLYNEISQQFNEILKKMISVYSINESEGSFSSFFRVQSTAEQKISLIDGSSNEKSSIIFMKYFINNLLNKKENCYNCDTFKAFVKQNMEFVNFNTAFSQELTEYIEALEKHDLSLTNIVIFLTKLKEKIADMKVQMLDKMTFLDQQIETAFINEVRFSICQQKCPCCDRICGLQGSHSDAHSCVYGHQIRAFAGTKLENGEASVCRCEDMTDTSQLKYNGRMMTWKQFKDEQQKRGWNFDDLANKNPLQQNQFLYVWKTVGEHFCSKYSMTFVEFNNAASSQNGSIHFIIALDESSSMNDPEKWPKVIQTLNQVLPTIKTIPNYQQNIKISILLLSSICKIYQENYSPDNTNFNNIVPIWGGTTFGPTFQTAYDLMKKYHTNSNIMFILLTDGEAEYPSNQIRQIKLLKLFSTNKIYYSGIEFKTTGKIMMNIKKDLDGKNYNVSTQRQLLTAFNSAIEIINTK